MMLWTLAIAALVIGILLLGGGRAVRRKRGLAEGRTTALDNRALRSVRYGLVGRPDRIIDGVIPEEWKSSKRVYDSHRAQLGVYFILIEEETGVRPTHGFISLKSGERVRVENKAELRDWVLGVAEQIRAARRKMGHEITVRQPPGKCRRCGMREGYGQKVE